MVKLYVWESEALRDYTPGYLIGSGESADEARESILKAWGYLGDKRLTYAIEIDLMEEPHVEMECGGFVVWGGSR